MTEPKARILVMDNEIAIGLMLKAGLEMYGFIVRYESRSTDAIQVCRDFQPMLIILDVDMPVKDGGEVAAELQRDASLRRIPVIFLTSLVSKEEAAKRKASDENLLAKPIPMAELVARIRAVLHPKEPQ